MGMKITPKRDQVLVLPLPEARQSAGGIWLPSGSDDKPTRGTVLAVGPGRFNDHTGERVPVDAKVGDQIVFSKYAGMKVKIKDQVVVLMGEKDLLSGLEVEEAFEDTVPDQVEETEPATA